MSEKVANPKKYAFENNLVIVPPGLNELQLDIDAKQLPKSFQEQLGILGQVNPVIGYHTTTSKSGNLHVYVQLSKPFSLAERVLMQACLGSDIKRELLTYKNMQDSNNTQPQFLFETAAPVVDDNKLGPFRGSDNFEYEDISLAELDRAA
jgi:hypothetical protein